MLFWIIVHALLILAVWVFSHLWVDENRRRNRTIKEAERRHWVREWRGY